jgi:hypothetical protein
MVEVGGHRSGEITPDTHVRMSLNKTLTVAGALVVIATGAAGAWFAVGAAIRDLSKELAVHIKNSEVHIEPGYQFDHGRPVGKHDVEAYQAATEQALEKLRESVDGLRTELVNKRHR